ncbi:hypothetical protein BG846_05366 [Streptomyces fradiae ATCC 10745 = DSM 40063]|uniref:Uncharacterized protein n=1 Tax=Streptomyces fradiae ATCC 10745 = DSM 40063 TaxID=1319510 RepID=A0A1Y2NNG0_STRFR|nr:hypothetical protein BG846_05366 [Streptomyces fradiae ATCC 10745 = DSM 40063]
MRYIRAPGAPNGSATNLSAVSPGRPQYPRDRLSPPMYSSPATPSGTGRRNASRTWTVLPSTRVPIGGVAPPDSGPLRVAHTVVSVGP